MNNFILCQDLNNSENRIKVENFIFQETVKSITKFYYPNQYMYHTNTAILSDQTTRAEIVSFIATYVTNNREITEEVKAICNTLGVVIKSRDSVNFTLNIIYNLIEYTVYFDDGTLPTQDYVVFESNNDKLNLDVIGQAKINQLSIPLRETSFYRYADDNKVAYFLIFYLAGLTLNETNKANAVKAYLMDTYPDTYAKDFPLLFIDDAEYVNHYIAIVDTDETIYSFNKYLFNLENRGLNNQQTTIKWNFLTKHNMIIDLSLDEMIDGLSSADMTTFFTLMQSIEHYLLYNIALTDTDKATYNVKYINTSSVKLTFPNFGNLIVTL